MSRKLRRHLPSDVIESGAVRLLKLPEVQYRTGLPRTAVYTDPALRLAKVKIGKRASAWDSRAVDRWIQDKLAAAAR